MGEAPVLGSTYTLGLDDWTATIREEFGAGRRLIDQITSVAEAATKEHEMQHASATRIIHATPAEVWPNIADVTMVDRWNATVATADLLSDNTTGMHAVRRCNFYDGTTVREEVAALDEGRRIRFQLTEFALPMKSVEAEISLVASGDGLTEAKFEMFFEMKFGIIGKLMAAMMVKRKMRKLMALMLAGIEHYTTTGDTVDQSFVPSAAG